MANLPSLPPPLPSPGSAFRPAPPPASPTPAPLPPAPVAAQPLFLHIGRSEMMDIHVVFSLHIEIKNCCTGRKF